MFVCAWACVLWLCWCCLHSLGSCSRHTSSHMPWQHMCVQSVSWAEGGRLLGVGVTDGSTKVYATIADGGSGEMLGAHVGNASGVGSLFFTGGWPCVCARVPV